MWIRNHEVSSVDFAAISAGGTGDVRSINFGRLSCRDRPLSVITEVVGNGWSAGNVPDTDSVSLWEQISLSKGYDVIVANCVETAPIE